MKQNCWEYNKCGLEVGGKREAEFGACAVAINLRYAGQNGGQNAGRYCWKVMGSLCFGRIERIKEEGKEPCIDCGFYKKVQEEEGAVFAV